MIDTVLIPADRIGVIKNKKAKKEIEDTLKVKIKFSGNLVEIEGRGLELYRAKLIAKAIGRGFSPERAFRLFDEEQLLDIIELKEFSEKRAATIKSRIIGRKGRAREEIENATGAAVSVYGKTVSLIGKWEEVNQAKEAILMILQGSRHASVYKYLEKIRKRVV